MPVIKHYGPYRLTLYEQDKRAVITRPRIGPDPLPDTQAEKVKAWLLNDLSKYVFDGFEIVDETQNEVSYE